MHVTYPRRHSLSFGKEGGGAPIGASSGGPPAEPRIAADPFDDIGTNMVVWDKVVVGYRGMRGSQWDNVGSPGWVSISNMQIPSSGKWE